MKHLFAKFLVTLTTILAATVSANSASTEWFETDGAKMRLISQTTPDTSGILKAVIEIDLEKGWKTYWREPGESGIPPQFNLTHGTNISHADVFFPAPVMFDDGYSKYAGYSDRVAFPIDVHVKDISAETHLKGEVFIGICSNICVPFLAEIDLDLANSAANETVLEAIETARIGLPSPQGNDFKVSDFAYDRTTHSAEFEITLPAFYPKGLEPELFVHAHSDWPMSQPEKIAISKGKVRFKSDVLKARETEEPLSNPVYVLLKLGQRAVETNVILDMK